MAPGWPINYDDDDDNDDADDDYDDNDEACLPVAMFCQAPVYRLLP